MFIVCVTACPTGIAHTFMAAESLQNVAHARGFEVKVETQGSLGGENVIDEHDLARADGVIIASEGEAGMDALVAEIAAARG